MYIQIKNRVTINMLIEGFFNTLLNKTFIQDNKQDDVNKLVYITSIINYNNFESNRYNNEKKVSNFAIYSQ